MLPGSLHHGGALQVDHAVFPPQTNAAAAVLSTLKLGVFPSKRVHTVTGQLEG
jgi:hypothetical protein